MTTLPTDIDLTYLDRDPADKLHQQHHDIIHGALNALGVDFVPRDSTHDFAGDATTPLTKFATFGAQVAVHGSVNAIVGMTINDRPASTTAFPAGLTGYGRTDNAGNQAFGIFGRADLNATGVATNECNVFNYAAAPAGTFPPDRSIGTTDHLPVALTVAAGGTYPSAIGVHIGREGSAPQPFLAGIYASPDACTTYGAFYDATSSVGPAAGVRVNVKDGSFGLDVRAQGVNSVPINLRVAAGQATYALRVEDATGANILAAIGRAGQLRPGNATTIGGSIWGGIGAPTLSGTSGDYYFRTDTPTTANQRLYVCTGGTSWTAIL